jgi:hypothetical protein
VILEILYNIWLGGVILFTLNMMSTFIFGKHNWVWRQLFASIWFTLIWPLALVSPEGRNHLFGKLHQL